MNLGNSRSWMFLVVWQYSGKYRRKTIYCCGRLFIIADILLLKCFSNSSGCFGGNRRKLTVEDFWYSDQWIEITWENVITSLENYAIIVWGIFGKLTKTFETDIL